MIPGEIASKAISEINVKNAERLRDFLAKEFGLTSDVDFEGIYPIIALLFENRDILIGVYTFFHDLHVLEKQVQNYIANLGADVKTAESDVTLAGQELLRIFTLGAYGGGIQP